MISPCHIPLHLSAVGGEGGGSGEESEEESEGGEEEEEEEGEEGGLVGEVGNHPFAAMTPDQDQDRKNQLGRSRPPTEEELQQKE